MALKDLKKRLDAIEKTLHVGEPLVTVLVTYYSEPLPPSGQQGQAMVVYEKAKIPQQKRESQVGRAFTKP